MTMTTRSTWRSVGSGIAMFALLLGLFGSLVGLHRARDRYSRLHNAAADLSITVNALAAVGWETIANGNAEADEMQEAQALVDDGNRFATLVVQLHTEQLGADVRGAWSSFSLSQLQMLQLVYAGDVAAADYLEEETVEEAFDQLAETLAQVRAETAALDAQADDAEIRRSSALIAAALLVLCAAFWMEHRRRRGAAVTDVLRAAQDSLRHEASHDALTGLANRVLFMETLDDELAASGRTGAAFAVLLIDLDRFKEVNDTFGHHTGDELLRGVAASLQRGVRDQDLVARLGGDEFAVLLPGVADAATAVWVTQRMLGELDSPIMIGGMALAVDASVGITLCPAHATEAGQLLRNADIAMYGAKRRRESIAVFDAASDVIVAPLLTMMGDLQTALNAPDEQLTLHYQPQIDAVDGGVHTVEALLRWTHPLLGPMRPAEFIPYVEQTHIIDRLTRFVLDQALAQLAAWDRQGLSVSMAVNVSVANLVDEQFPRRVAAALSHHGIRADRLEIELTETALAADQQRVSTVVAALASSGVRIVLDDYGTGYSSLASLQKLPLDVIKIDRSFVSGMIDSPRDAAIVKSTIALARSLGLVVVAEGVETVEQAAALRRLECHRMQGFLFSRPLQGDDLGHDLRASMAAPALA